MSARVKIESDCRSSVISQQALEGAAGVEEAGSTAVLPGEQRPASLPSVDDNRRTAREDEAGQALDVKALDSPAAGSAGTEPPGSNVQNLKGALGGTVRQNFPAPDTTTRKAAADNSSGVCATPTRKSSRIRNAQAHQAEADLAVNTISIDEASARAIICAAVNDAVIGLVKSPPFVKTLAGLVREQVLEAAVAAVEGILKSTLQPQLEKATKDILTAAASMKAAVDVMEHATAALKAATSAETGADTPVEAKSGGRKGKAKKGVASASLGTSGEEALLLGTEHDQLLEVMKGALSDSLTAQLDPRFQQLLTCVQTALQQSVQAVGETAAVENAIVAKNLELISHQVRGLQESIDNNFRGLQASCDKNAKELRRLANACNTRKDERSRSATRSASLTTSAQRKGKRAAPSPSSSTSSDASSSSSDSSGEAPTPPPAAKKKHKFTRRASGATSANSPSSIGTNTVYASKQQQQPQLPQSQHPPALQQQQQQQLPQSQQPPALQQQQYQYRYQMAPQIGVTQPSMGPCNNIGIPAVAPQVQTAANCPMSYLPWAYSFQK